MSLPEESTSRITEILAVPRATVSGTVTSKSVPKKTGAFTYNLVHNFALAALLIGSGLFTGNTLLTSLGLILTAHIGADRFLGFGLKYTTDFKDTHIQRL